MAGGPFQVFSRGAGALRRRVRAWRAVRVARESTQARFAGAQVRRVLVVCYGNIYRSPLFGEILRAEAGDVIEVRSAGFHPKTGRASPPPYVEMCARRGFALAPHRSAAVTPDDLRWADTIVLMDRHNWGALEGAGADPAKLVWAGALSEGTVEIEDPYGRPAPEVDRIIGQLESSARRFIERVRGKVRS
jgi:protein-tyrosine phosphatase